MAGARHFRLGVVNFINTAPFLMPFKEMGPVEGWEVLEASPSVLNRKLENGEIDAGLISSLSFGVNSGRYLLMNDYCISATGTVGSVVLFSRLPIYELDKKTVCLTRQSLTSVNLLYIILEHFNGLAPGYVPGGLEDFEADADIAAYLAIGDEALRLRGCSSGFFFYDLASIWYEATSLPFVFALWAIRKDSGLAGSQELRVLNKRLRMAYSSGAERLGEIAAIVCSRIPMPQADCLSYLKGIEFDLSDLKARGLEQFFRLLFQMGKIPGLPAIERA